MTSDLNTIGGFARQNASESWLSDEGITWHDISADQPSAPTIRLVALTNFESADASCFRPRDQVTYSSRSIAVLDSFALTSYSALTGILISADFSAVVSCPFTITSTVSSPGGLHAFSVGWSGGAFQSISPCQSFSQRALSCTIAVELEGLEDGWAGKGTVAPSAEVVRDVVAVLDQLLSARRPSIEVDPDDGAVSLRWVSSDGGRSLSLVFLGNGRVSAVDATANPPRSKAWSTEVGNDVQIAAKLDEWSAVDLITE